MPPKRPVRSESDTPDVRQRRKRPRKSNAVGARVLVVSLCTVDEVFDWPEELLNRVLPIGAECREHALRLYGMVRGMQWVITSDYAGMDCPRESLRLAHQALVLKKLAHDTSTAPRF